MSAEVSIACKYESFNTLVQINDPELLLEAFLSQLTPDYTGQVDVEIFERKGFEWHKLHTNGNTSTDFDEQRRFILEHKIDPEQTSSWFYQASQIGWYCGYKPLSSKQYAMFFSIGNPDEAPIDEDYIQLLFGFYCHQLCSLERTYRDSLTGLYNRKAFDLRMAALLQNSDNPARRNNLSKPSTFVMLDIDLFKQVNDEFGHRYGDEVLTIVAKLMIDSFREYDLLFRYGGEEFSAVLMDIENEICIQVLNRFRKAVEAYEFPKPHRLTVSIGYTDFNRNITLEQLIDQADKALYYAKKRGRNRIYHYEDLIRRNKIEGIEPEEKAQAGETSETETA